MKISKGTVEITEIPYFEKIIVTPNLTTLDDGETPYVISRENLISLRNALTAALNAHDGMTAALVREP